MSNKKIDFSDMFESSSKFTILGDAHEDKKILSNFSPEKKSIINQNLTEIVLKDGITESSYSTMYDLLSEIIHDIMNSKDIGTMRLLQDINKHDKYTYDHCWSVFSVGIAILSQVIKQDLVHYSQEDLVNFGLGALLHDLGKLKISNEILNKPGKLNESEWLCMKRHPEFGVDLATKYKDLPIIARDIIANHHQRVDGKGYGAGEYKDYTVAVRIISVADVYDALVSNRPYRHAMLPLEASKILQNGAGTQFESLYVDLLNTIIISYPPGSYMLTASGALLKVMPLDKWVKNTPKVKVIYNLKSDPICKTGQEFLFLEADGKEEDFNVIVCGRTPEAFVEKFYNEKTKLPQIIQQRLSSEELLEIINN